MLNKTLLLSVLLLIALSDAIAAPTTYNFSSPTYVAASGVYDTSMRVTGSITTDNPYPANQDFIFDGDFGVNVTSFSFSDGVQTISSSNGGVIEEFNWAFFVGTDASGNINHMQIIVNSTVATAVGDKENMIGFAIPNDPSTYSFTTFGFGVQGVTCGTYIGGLGCSDSLPNIDNLGISSVDHFDMAFPNHIKFVPDAGSVGFVSFEAQGGQTISNYSVTATSNHASKPAGLSSPHGQIAYQVTTSAPGGTATVRLVFSSPLPGDFSLYKVKGDGSYDPDPIPQQAGADAWVKVNDTTIDLTLTDGGKYDLDLDNTNSLITDPFIVLATTSQTITFNALSDLPMGSSPFSLSATASSGLAVSYSSTTTGVCTVSGSTVTILSTGTCTIRASQPGDAFYNAATDVDQSFTVTPAATTTPIPTLSTWGLIILTGLMGLFGFARNNKNKIH